MFCSTIALFIIVLSCKEKTSLYKGRQTYLIMKKMDKLPEISMLSKSNLFSLKEKGYKYCELASRFGFSKDSVNRILRIYKTKQVFHPKREVGALAK